MQEVEVPHGTFTARCLFLYASGFEIAHTEGRTHCIAYKSLSFGVSNLMCQEGILKGAELPTYNRHFPNLPVR